MTHQKSRDKIVSAFFCIYLISRAFGHHFVGSINMPQTFNTDLTLPTIPVNIPEPQILLIQSHEYIF